MSITKKGKALVESEERQTIFARPVPEKEKALIALQERQATSVHSPCRSPCAVLGSRIGSLDQAARWPEIAAKRSPDCLIDRMARPLDL